MIFDRVRLDRIMVGWNGTSAASTTDPSTNTLGEDVNIGWFQLLENQDPDQFLKVSDGSGGTTSTIRVGTGSGDHYANVDQLCDDLKNLIPRHLRDNLVVIAGDEIVSTKAQHFWANAGKPSEYRAISSMDINLHLGGMPVIKPAFMPARGLMITSLNNLSLYYQSSSRRRSIKEMPEKNGINDFNSVNEGYVIEKTDKCAAILSTNIVLPGDPA